MTMPTWIPLFAGANWHERETHEMFGIGFDGHPDLRNLYLPGEFEGLPLRKDFPLLSPHGQAVARHRRRRADARVRRETDERCRRANAAMTHAVERRATMTMLNERQQLSYIAARPPTPASTSSSRPRA